MLLSVLLVQGVWAKKSKYGTATGQVVITYQNGFDPATSGDGIEHEKKYAEYSNINPNIKIVHNIMTYDQSRQKFIIGGQAGSSPDAIHMLGEWIPDFVEMGLLQDITSEVKSWKDYSSFPESTWKVATVDGKIYGIPSIASTRVLIYRGDLLKAAGCTVPVTWNDLRKTAKAMTKDTDGDGKTDVYGFAFCSSSKAVRGPQEFSVFLNSVDHGELAVEKDGKWIPGFTPDQVEKVFQLYYDLLFVDKSVPPYSVGWEWDELDPSFASGSVAMVMDGAWIQQRIDGGYKPETWKTASFPYCSNPATYMEVKVEGVGKFSKYPKETMKFLEWLYGRDNMVAITQTDNLPSRSDAVDSPLWVPDSTWKETFLKNVKYGFSFPSIPLGPVFESTMKYTQKVLYKQLTPHQAAAGFYNDTKKYLDSEINK